MTTETSYNAEDKPEFVADMEKCTLHLQTILSAVRSADQVKLQQLTTKQEALNESIQKIFVNLKEEWKLVLSKTRAFMDLCLEILRLNNSVNSVLDLVCEFLRSLTLCISPKRLARYWPTEVEWLTKLVNWIEQFFDRNVDDQRWITLFVLVLWLSSAVKTPFDLSRFDSADCDVKFVTRISAILKRTSNNYNLFSVFHILAGNFYSRDDILRDSSNFFAEFMELQVGDLSNPSFHERLCRFRAIATVLKKVDRRHLEPYFGRIFESVKALVDSNHELQTKYCIKILGRLALAQIKTKLLKYRYSCGKRVIDFDNLKEESKNLEAGDQESENLVTQVQESTEEEEESIDLPDYFESLIQILIDNIHNPAGQEIHYSVAKYLASICWRLPQELTDDILEHICGDLCQPFQDANAWHGACLTLAEFIRRGYVPIHFMPKIVQVIKKGLFFEEIKGSFSLGSFVRDSAAYICWSMARGYDGQVIGDFVEDLAPVLINSVCFDKDLNVRRASSAVIQELAGRTQKFPHWIEVIGKTDFNSLNKIERTYTDMGFYFGSNFAQFSEPMIEHLCETKSVHCEPLLRRLAARTLGELSKVMTFKDSKFCWKFYELANGKDMNARHGAILSLAYLALNDSQLRCSPEFCCQVTELVPNLSQKNLFAGIGGDFMRESCLTMIKHCCLVGLETQDLCYLTSWQELIINTIQHCETDFVQQPLVDACKVFWKGLAGTQSLEFGGQLVAILSSFNNYSPISTVSRILQVVDEELFTKEMLDVLLRFFDTAFPLELRNSETIAESVKAIMTISNRFCRSENYSPDSGMGKRIVGVWLRALNDHTINKTKGDVGLYVRKAGIQCVERCLRKGGFLEIVMNDAQIFELFRLILEEALQCQKMTFVLASESLSMISKFCIQEKRQVMDPIGLSVLGDQNIDFQESFLEDIYFELLKFFNVPKLALNVWQGSIGILAQPSMKKLQELFFQHVRSLSGHEMVRSIWNDFFVFLKAAGEDSRIVYQAFLAVKTLLLEVGDMESCDLEFQRRLADACWENCQRIKNVKNYVAACDVFCSLIPLSGSAILRKVYSYIYVMLGFKTPRIRSHAAMELYAAVLSLDDFDADLGEVGDGGGIDKICDLLQNTDWANYDESCRVRDELRTNIRNYCATIEA